MQPGASIKRHFHPRLRESVYVAAGEMINGDNGTVLPAGSFLVHGPGIPHGPHQTKSGCTLLFIQYPIEIPTDGVFVVGPADSVFMETAQDGSFDQGSGSNCSNR